RARLAAACAWPTKPCGRLCEPGREREPRRTGSRLGSDPAGAGDLLRDRTRLLGGRRREPARERKQRARAREHARARGAEPRRRERERRELLARRWLDEQRRDRAPVGLG